MVVSFLRNHSDLQIKRRTVSWEYWTAFATPVTRPELRHRAMHRDQALGFVPLILTMTGRLVAGETARYS
jgi:hypothetical protein